MQLTRIFKYEGDEVRVISREGEPWFVAADVCKILDLADASRAVERLDEDEKGTSTIRTLGGKQEMLIVSEPGLYNLIFTSRKPEAKDFRRWVTHDVLPSIAKRGKFVLPEVKAFRKRGKSNMKASEGLFERGDIPSLGFVLEQAAYMYGCSVDEFKGGVFNEG